MLKNGQKRKKKKKKKRSSNIGKIKKIKSDPEVVIFKIISSIIINVLGFE